MDEHGPRKRRRTSNSPSKAPPVVNTGVSSPPTLPDPSTVLSVPRCIDPTFSATACQEQTLELGHTTCLETTRPRRIGSRWYTSMLGKLSSVVEVVEVIQRCKVSKLNHLCYPRFLARSRMFRGSNLYLLIVVECS
jgi:hypothetical protein